MEAKYNMSAESLLAGMAFNQTGCGIARGLGEAFQIEYNIQHATAIGIILPHVMSFNLTEKPSLYGDLARAMEIAGERLS